MQTLNYALAQVVQQERARELDVAAHIAWGARSPRNVRSLRTVLASWAYSTYNGTHPRGHYRPGGRSTWPKGPCGRVADENTSTTSLD